ncbi:cytochrome P450 6A1-like [Zophobas morio]|uniref:cytochrome P450 6A1-like n=1 Tax=Zophobas morio TaxID=2755281 RepID=UPI0030830991
MLILTVLVVKFLTGIAAFAFFKWKFTYWKRKNMPFIQPQFPFGNVPNPFTVKQAPGLIFTQLYKEMKRKGWPHGGIYVFTKPLYLLVDPDCIKTIMTKDFEYFNSRGIYYNEKDDPVSAHVLHVGGTKWKTLRSKLNPTFTASKVKIFFPIMVNRAEKLLKKLWAVYHQSATLDSYNTMSCFTIDILGSCAFGLDCKALEDDSSVFTKSIMKCVELSKLRVLTILMASVFPKAARNFKVRHYPKDIGDFFINFVTNVVKQRQENVCTRQDFMQQLIDLKNHNAETLSTEEMAAQCLIFFLAGFETSSITMTFALYELSKQQKFQDRVRQEITQVLAEYNNEISYEMITDLKYLNQVIDETFRKYPAVLYLTRKCSKTYCEPNKNIVIEKGTLVLIPLHGIHHDEEYYPEPEKFDPERFNDTNKKARHHYKHLPFGAGPRMCIGQRLALLQVKLGLFMMLRNFKFSLNERTEEPVKLTMNSTIVKPEGEIWLDICPA